MRAREDADGLLARLRGRGVEAALGPIAGSLVMTRGEGEVLEEVESGSAWIQDPTNQRVAPLLGARPGDRILDLCAAPGGKTLHVADLLGVGHVTAADADAKKVTALAKLAARMGGVELEVVCVPTEGALPFEADAFDAILVDAPCTNTGVLRRRVEARWRLRPEDVASLASIQSGLLERALPHLRPGGRLVYSTCSLEPEENEDIAGTLLGAHPELEREDGFMVFPDRDHDGGFAAVFRKPK